MSTVLSAKAALLAGTPTLVQPTVVEALDPTTGLISAATANVGITVNCTLGDFSDDFDWIEIQRQDLSLPLPNWTTIHGPVQLMLPAAGNTVDVPVPAPTATGGFVHGRYQVRHLLYVNQFGDPSIPGDVDRPGDLGEFSVGALFTVDRIAPYASAGTRDQPPVAVYTGTLLPGEPVTQSFLNAAGGLPFNIPDNAYPIPSGQWAIGDTLKYYWSPNLFPQPQFEVGGLIPLRPMLQTGNTFLLPASAITTSGLLNFFYTITDLAGNVSRPAVVASFNVSLLPAPEQKEIFIPFAPAPEGGSLDNLLNILDYRTGIEAWVRTYLNKQPADQIQLKWGTQPVTALSPTFTTFPLIFNSLNTLIVDDYAQRKGRQPTDIQYRIVRNGESFDSLVKTVDVDLSVTGVVNPGDPGTRNPDLPPPHIFGQGSLVPDVLRAEHANLPVTMAIDLWTLPDLPAPGMFIFGVWDGVVIPTPFPITTELPGDRITLTFLWDIVAANGNGPHAVHYFVSPTATPNTLTDNLNNSPDTLVEVIDAVTLALAPPVYQRVVGSGASAQWTCDSLGPRPQTTPVNYDGQIFVPGDARFVLGQQLTLTVRVFTPRTLPVRDQGTRTFTQTINAAIQTSGFMFTVPFDLLKIARLGGAQAISSAPLTDNVIGRGMANLNVRSVLSQTYCDLSVVPPLPPLP